MGNLSLTIIKSVICGLITLRLLALFPVTQIMITIFSIKLQHPWKNIRVLFRDPFGVLSEPLTYEEVVKVCSNLKLGVSGVYVDYEHIRYGGPPLWQLIFELYREFLEQSSASKSLKTGLILPLFKGKGAKANNKDNYRGITLFPTLCKIYEMILLNRLETYATEKGYFLSFGLVFAKVLGASKLLSSF